MSNRLILAVSILFATGGCNEGILKQDSDTDRTLDIEYSQLTGSSDSKWSSAFNHLHLARATSSGPISNQGFRANGIPPEFKSPNAIYLAGPVELNLKELLRRLTEITSITHSVSKGDPDSIQQKAMIGRISTDMDAGPLVKPNFHGSLPEILDQLAAEFDMDWQYENGKILFREFISREYRISALPLESSVSNKVGSANSSASVDFMPEIHATLELLAGPEAKVSFGTGTGIAVITARPTGHDRIESYIHNLNIALGRQVAFDVNVLTVNLSRSESSGTGFELLAKNGRGNQISWTQDHALVGASSTVNVGMISGEFSLDAMVTALKREGEVTVETRAGATTSNNSMVPIQVVREIAYAKSVESVVGELGDVSTAIEPGTLITGFEMHLLPRVLDDSQILLRYSVRLSDLEELAEFASDRQSIQLPRVATTSFEQQAILMDGQTLVLAGFERDRRANNKSGEGSGFLAALFGAKRGSSSERVSTILTIRPRILDRQHQQDASGPANPSGVGFDG